MIIACLILCHMNDYKIPVLGHLETMNVKFAIMKSSVQICPVLLTELFELKALRKKPLNGTLCISYRSQQLICAYEKDQLFLLMTFPVLWENLLFFKVNKAKCLFLKYKDNCVLNHFIHYFLVLFFNIFY